jgi:hypothetical protein
LPITALPLGRQSAVCKLPCRRRNDMTLMSERVFFQESGHLSHFMFFPVNTFFSMN